MIRALNVARRANDNVDGHAHTANLLAVLEVAGLVLEVGRREAYLVLAGLAGGEREAALGLTLLLHDAVVVVEHLVDGDVQPDRAVGLEFLRVGVVLLHLVVALRASGGHPPIEREMAYRLSGCPWAAPRRSTLAGRPACRSGARWRGGRRGRG